MTDTNGINLRPYQPAEEAQLVELWQTCGLTHPTNDPNRDIALKLTQLPEGLLVAEHERRIIGSVMAGYEGHRGWINYLAVHPDYQRQGLGRALMQRAEQLLHALGCRKINLQIRKTNTAVIAFYQRIGFTEDAVVSMGKRLS